MILMKVIWCLFSLLNVFLDGHIKASYFGRSTCEANPRVNFLLCASKYPPCGFDSFIPNTSQKDLKTQMKCTAKV
jgi:hypothetical protein